MTFIYLVAFVLVLICSGCVFLMFPCSFILQCHSWPLVGNPHHTSTSLIQSEDAVALSVYVNKLGGLGEPVVLHLAVQIFFTGTLVFNPHGSDHYR